MISHENTNTLIACIGLIVGLVTAWNQFGPSKDELDIEVTGRVEFSTPFEETGFFPGQRNGHSQKTAGPVFWKAVLYNKLDRPVTIKEIETLMISDSGGLIDYSDLEYGFFELDKSLVHLPLTIEPRNAKAIVLGLNIPVVQLADKQDCFMPDSTKRDIEVCYFSKGIDIFGNTVEYSEIPNPNGNPFVSASWPNGAKSPEFISRIRTGDNTDLSVRFQYYPAMR